MSSTTAVNNTVNKTTKKYYTSTEVLKIVNNKEQLKELLDQVIEGKINAYNNREVLSARLTREAPLILENIFDPINTFTLQSAITDADCRLLETMLEHHDVLQLAKFIPPNNNAQQLLIEIEWIYNELRSDQGMPTPTQGETGADEAPPRYQDDGILRGRGINMDEEDEGGSSRQGSNRGRNSILEGNRSREEEEGFLGPS